jgi:hypothetical protein
MINNRCFSFTSILLNNLLTCFLIVQPWPTYLIWLAPDYNMCEHFNRTGVLCGRCQPEHYPLAYSYDLACAKCHHISWNWVLEDTSWVTFHSRSSIWSSFSARLTLLQAMSILCFSLVNTTHCYDHITGYIQ